MTPTPIPTATPAHIHTHARLLVVQYLVNLDQFSDSLDVSAIYMYIHTLLQGAESIQLTDGSLDVSAMDSSDIVLGDSDSPKKVKKKN